MADLKNQAAAVKPEQILEIVLRRRWIIVVPICIFLTLGLVYTLISPKVYETSTTILIKPQEVPSGYVQSVVTTDNEQRINTISKLILSRTNLERIISEFGLYQDNPNMYLEDKIQDMRERIAVQQDSRYRSGTEAFTISFHYKDSPELVRDIVNKLASLFMDENLKARESQAIGTSEFLESELEKIKGKLEEREQVLAAYRAQYLGGLPDELETNLRTLDRLQLQHTDTINALRDAQNNAALLKSEISRLREAAQNTTAVVQQDGTIVEGAALTPTQQQYEIEKRQLSQLLLKYTQKHPEVVKLTRSIEKLGQKIAEEEKERKPEARDTADAGSQQAETPVVPDSPANAQLLQAQFNLKQLENEISGLKVNVEEIKKQEKIYQKRVEDTPKREQELQSIQRDYNNIRESYNSLLARRLEAEISVNMEKKQKGEQFRIIDYARVPQKPISPNVQKMLLFSLALSLGAGGGIVFLLEFLNPAIRSQDTIENDLGLPVLATVPPLAKPGDRVKGWISNIAFSLAGCYALMVFGFFALMHLKGIDKTTSFLKNYINI